MSLHVNDEEWSAYNTARMEWSFAELLAYLSQGQTVQPGQEGSTLPSIAPNRLPRLEEDLLG